MKKRNPRLLLAVVNVVHAMALGRKAIQNLGAEATFIPLLLIMEPPVRFVPQLWLIVLVQADYVAASAEMNGGEVIA